MSKARPGNYKRCISCEKEFTKEGSSAYNAAGRCKKCYGAYIRKNGYTHCQICGVELPSKLMKPNCKMCKLKVKSGLLETEKYIPTKRNKYYTAHSERVAKSYQLTSKRLDQIKLILIKNMIWLVFLVLHITRFVDMKLHQYLENKVQL